MPPVELRVADDGEVLFRGPTLFKGYWRDPEATARAVDADGWYHTGDIGHLDPTGRLILSGRTKDRIVLPNGFKVYPEDLENALRVAGIRDAIVVETAPGRIEAVVAPAGAGADGRRRRPRSPVVDAAVRAANATLGPQQRIVGLAALARRRLPADAHAQDPARPDPGMGGRCDGDRARGCRGGPAQFGTVNPIPSVPSTAATDARRPVGRGSDGDHE